MIDQSRKAKRLYHWIHLSTDFQADVGWWQAFLQACYDAGNWTVVNPGCHVLV